MKKNFKTKVIAILLAILTVTAVIPFAAMSTSAAAWNGSTASSFESGSGTEDDPYIIKTAEQLALLAKNVNDGRGYMGSYFKLESDIVLGTSSVKRNWPGIGQWYVNSNGNDEFIEFNGTFDGNGKTISGLFVSVSGQRGAGLFGCLNGATIKNLKIKGADIRSESRAGILASCSFYGRIENCSVDGKVVGDELVGGISGYSVMETISGCSSTASVDGAIDVGGIVGEGYYTDFNNCTNSGNVIGNQYVGGIVGDITEGSILNSKNSGKVQTRTEQENYNCGGIVGSALASNIDKCENSGEVIGIENVGGIAGTAECLSYEGDDERTPSKITNCKNSGKVGKLASDTDYHEPIDIGGIVGYFRWSTLNNCSNTGIVLGYEDISGIVGYAEELVGNLENCYNSGDITGVNWIAGIAAYIFSESTDSYTQINYCANTGDIKGEYCVGGIAGFYGNDSGKAQISECYNSGNIQGNYYVAGIVADTISQYNDCVVSYCANDGKITLNLNEDSCVVGGGIIGQAESTKIVQCVNNGTSSYGNNNFFGGIVGHSHYGNVKLFDCKYLNTSAKLGYAAENHETLTADMATPLSASALMDESNFTTYDFDNIFKMGDIGVVPKIAPSFNAPTFLLGDVNGDGVVDKKDYAALKRYCFGTVTLSDDSLLAADVNHDNVVDKKDYAFLKRYCFGTVAL